MPDGDASALNARVHEVTMPLIGEVAGRLQLDPHGLALLTAALTLAAAEGVRAGAEELAARAAERGVELEVPGGGPASLDEVYATLVRSMGLE